MIAAGSIGTRPHVDFETHGEDAYELHTDQRDAIRLNNTGHFNSHVYDS